MDNLEEKGRTTEAIQVNPDNALLEYQRDKYLESIGPLNKQNVQALIKAFEKELNNKEGTNWFLYAVGGTVTKADPANRKDVVLLLGIEFPALEKPLPLLEMYKEKFARWETAVLRALERSRETDGFRIKSEPRVVDQDRSGEIPRNDGSVKIFPSTGTAIELLCDQSGQKNVKSPYVILRSTKPITITSK